MNHFELFGLSCRFDLDDSFVTSQFIELQRRFHPDKFASSTEQERLFAVKKAAQINDAYHTLRHPLHRAEYILLLNGEDLRNEQITMQDPDFLMQQMMLREELEDISEQEDAEEQLIHFDKKVQVLRDELMSFLRNEFEKNQWKEAAVTVRKLKFLAKLKQEIERIEDQLFM